MNQMTLFQKIEASVFEGDAGRARILAGEALRCGLDPLFILEKCYTKALRSVGDSWEQGTLFLPEMILSAEAVKGALQVLKPRLRAAAAEPDGSLCVLGTVRGDVHDIGKNIVGTMLEAFGFTVVDLGTDVEAERFVGAVRETGAGLVGLSALLTSTMLEMKSVLRALEEAGLRAGVRVAIGGAPVNSRFAEEIGADGYADDGGEALRLFQRLAARAESAPAGKPARGARDAV